MTSSKNCARNMSSARPRSTHSRQAALLVGPSDCPCEVEPLGVGSLGSELGVDDAGFFLGPRNPLNCVCQLREHVFLG